MARIMTRTRTHIIIATIMLIVVVGLGLLKGVINVFEGIIGAMLILILIPFLSRFLHHVPRHDNKFRDIDRGET